ncbi:acyltransferase family protein [Fibrella arboris]|uniref:acyltransferase family protein n=1 Tax=Fibrella arboris TaxID=3242486 RepID=UPI003522758E
MQTDSAAPTSPTIAPATRRYDLDWLRLLAIVILLFYHTGMIYVSWGWHIKSPEHSQPMEEVMRWLHRWRMPLLFFISGAGTFFALQKRSYGAYASERVRRLFIPLVFGMFVVVPPQIYIEWLFRGRFTGSYLDFYPEVLRFQSYKDGGSGGAFSWHHLWFICYLFFYSLLSIPVFRWLNSTRGQLFTNWLGTLLVRRGGALWLVVPLLVNDVVLGGLFPRETHGLVDDWAYFMKNLLLFWLGYLLISRRAFWQLLADQRRAYFVATLICTALLYGSRTILSDDEIDQNALIRTLYSFNSICLTWFSVLMTVGYGYTYLNKNHRWLPQLNAAVYPFYILHQTVIVVVGYYVLTRTGLGVYSGFLTVSFVSLAICLATYLLLIRPIPPMRLFFGVK